MDNISYRIINYMTKSASIFKTRNVSGTIVNEVPFFAKALRDGIQNPEFFHGTINSIYTTWYEILSDDFKKLIDTYNIKYIEFQNRNQEMQNEMVRMAAAHDASLLDKDLSDMFIFSRPFNINDLSNSMAKSKISKSKI